MKDFLGSGWTFPVVVDATGRIALSKYEEDIREALRIILLTAKGERMMRPDFGASLHDYVFESMGATTIGRLQAAITDALVKWARRDWKIANRHRVSGEGDEHPLQFRLPLLS